ncbi:MAG: hypothetical protein LBN06_01570 [Prevotellaceae bacterium]|jgi:hypothetical protein|nr:hypothetical protein [Prevotellaceae bacterium]
MTTKKRKNQENQPTVLKDEIMDFDQLFEVQGGMEKFERDCGLGCFTNGVIHTGTNTGGNDEPTAPRQ